MFAITTAVPTTTASWAAAGPTVTTCASSVPTNIAEGTGRQGNREFRHFLYVARGSVEEVKYLLLLGKDLGYLSLDDYEHLREGYDTAGRMLNGLINSLKESKGSHD